MDYWLVTTGEDTEPGINGAIMQRPEPVASGLNYVNVDSIDQVTEKVSAGGGSIMMGKMPIPSVGYVAVCRDTEGNAFGLFQDDSSGS